MLRCPELQSHALKLMHVYICVVVTLDTATTVPWVPGSCNALFLKLCWNRDLLCSCDLRQIVLHCRRNVPRHVRALILAGAFIERLKPNGLLLCPIHVYGCKMWHIETVLVLLFFVFHLDESQQCKGLNLLTFVPHHDRWKSIVQKPASPQDTKVLNSSTRTVSVSHLLMLGSRHAKSDRYWFNGSPVVVWIHLWYYDCAWDACTVHLSCSDVHTYMHRPWSYATTRCFRAVNWSCAVFLTKSTTATCILSCSVLPLI